MSNHMSAEDVFLKDEAGFYIPECTCGWVGGPVPSDEDVVDALMDHAYEIGRRVEKVDA